MAMTQEPAVNWRYHFLKAYVSVQEEIPTKYGLIWYSTTTLGSWNSQWKKKQRIQVNCMLNSTLYIVVSCCIIVCLSHDILTSSNIHAGTNSKTRFPVYGVTWSYIKPHMYIAACFQHSNGMWGWNIDPPWTHFCEFNRKGSMIP